MEQSFQIKEIILILKKKLKSFIFIPLSIALATYLLSSFIISPVYESRSDLLVSNSASENMLSATDIETNLRLIKTYQFILESKRIRDRVVEEIDNIYTSNELAKMLRIETNNDSQVISLYVVDSDPDMAATIVNLFAQILQEEVSDLMNISNITILTEASVGEDYEQIHPKPILYTIISYLIGFVLIVLYLLISEYFNLRINSKYGVENYLKLPVIGVVGILSVHKKAKGSRKINDQYFISRTTPLLSPELEGYRTIRTNIQFQSVDNPIKSILVTSSVTGEGKTVTSFNLAVVMAMDNKKTVVIDADLRKVVKKELLEDEDFNQIGLTSYLLGEVMIDDIVSETLIPNLMVINTGPTPSNPAELLSSQRMSRLIQKLKARYDFVIIDSPSLTFSDPTIMATKVDGCIFVVHSGVTKVNVAEQALELLKNVNAPIIGAVLNKDLIKVERYGTK